uniref:NADH dehydrogenase subunit 4L n=1 Tax=Bradysia odoriphaga TaxID=1564500 RepID=UPI001FA74597|nr:NADH dehydrogenase subunit 4L [Bradysia odoriphaga]UMY76238.1 NADH dehydrogenase subunit 4L [Bradysia odoriphaga]
MIMNLYIYIPIFMCLIGSLVYVSNRKYLLITLLSLEYLMLSLFLFLYLYMMNNSLEMYFLMLFLVFSVCEGALGLSVLVSMIRTHGNNYFQSFNTLLC